MNTTEKYVPGMLCLFSAPLLDPDGNPLQVLDLDSEFDEIIKSTTQAGLARLRFDFATVELLLNSVTTGFNIIHFSGHGHPDFLLFEDGNGGCHVLDKDHLKKVFAQAKGVDLAVVSACYSENTARLLLDAGVKYAVAIRKDEPVYDFAAALFTGKFYDALFKGQSIQSAFQSAKLGVEGSPRWKAVRNSIRLQCKKEGKPFIEEERKFLLLPDHLPINDGVGIPSRETDSENCSSRFMGCFETNLPDRQLQMFTGRAVEMHQLINLLGEQRLVTVNGAGGIGKTALAIETGRWFHLRNLFEDGVFKIDLRSMDSGDSVMQKIITTMGVDFINEEQFLTYIKPLHTLLVLDNAEDVLCRDHRGFRRLMDKLLQTAGKIKLLVTSQKEIGGNLYEKEELYNLSGLDRENSIELFIKGLREDLCVRDEALDRLIHLLGGHPLSLTIMARQVGEGCSVADLLQELESKNAEAVKTVTDVDLDYRLVLALSSAYDHLSPKVQTVFQVLAYFPNGIHWDDLEKILGESCRDLTAQLLDVSLVDVNHQTRLSLHPAVRLFAVDVLRDEVKEEYEPRILAFTAELSKLIHNNFDNDQACNTK